MQYRRFREIDGRHPWRAVIPDACVDYPARTRRGGRVFYFNFELAKEMGLIPKRHPHRLNAALSRAILDTFSLVIINEYDEAHKLRVPAGERRPHPYMATRYLQCQHPSRTGRTSGDGRSIWNGCFKGTDGLWDISSCGTGATRLSPATAVTGKFYKTGDDHDAYACGQADLVDGVCAALMSDIFHKNGIATERTLAVVAFDDGTAVNVRAHRNLLRPAHLFRLLKQNRIADLRAALDYYIARQRVNGRWPRGAGTDKYRTFLRQVTCDFARAAALFDSEYIFCWLDWDGDNVLMDGSVLDYGSVRQFGLYHHEYRYDDVQRFSTTITEQRRKARGIVQTFAQIVDAVISGRRRPLRRFAAHPALREFDASFERTQDERLADKLGYDETQRRLIMANAALRRQLGRLRVILRLFERVQSRKGVYRIEDGITADALFCVRDILRELPAHCLRREGDMDAARFIEIMKSEYAGPRDVLMTPVRRRRIAEFQRRYRALVRAVAVGQGRSERAVLQGMAARSALINRYERVTGDAVIYAAEKLVAGAARLPSTAVQAMFHQFVEQQVLRPEHFSSGDGRPAVRGARARRLLVAMLHDVKVLRAGI
jgi:uncharacterized protein YdiU (UPF0061 family)